MPNYAQERNFFMLPIFKSLPWCRLKQYLFFLMFCFLFVLTHKKKIKPYITHIHFLSLINTHTHTWKLLVFIRSQSNNNHKQYIKSPKIQNGPSWMLELIETGEAQTTKLPKLLGKWWRAGSTSRRHSLKIDA